MPIRQEYSFCMISQLRQSCIYVIRHVLSRMFFNDTLIKIFLCLMSRVTSVSGGVEVNFLRFHFNLKRDLKGCQKAVTSFPCLVALISELGTPRSYIDHMRSAQILWGVNLFLKVLFLLPFILLKFSVSVIL